MIKICALLLFLAFAVQSHSKEKWLTYSRSPTIIHYLDDSSNLSDSLFLTIRKIYLEANKANQNQNLSSAFELYSQFVRMTAHPKLEKRFWSDLRSSWSYMSTISTLHLDYERSLHFLKNALAISMKYDLNDKDSAFYFLMKIASCYDLLDDYYNGLEYNKQAEVLFHSTKLLSKDKMARLYHNMALCYLKLGMDIESQNYIEKSIRINESLGNLSDVANSFNIIATIHQSRGNFPEALSFFKQSTFLYDSLHMDMQSAFILNNIGNLFLRKSSYDTCKYYYNKSLKIRELNPSVSKEELIHSYNNVAYINYHLNNLDSALYYNSLAFRVNTYNDHEPNSDKLYSLSAYFTSIEDRIEINLKRFEWKRDKQFLEESFSFFKPVVELLIGQMTKYNSLVSSNVFLKNTKRVFSLSMVSSFLLDSLSPTNCSRTFLISEAYKSLSLINIPSEIRNLQNDNDKQTQFEQTNYYYQLYNQLLSGNQEFLKNSKDFLIDTLINGSILLDKCRERYSGIVRTNIERYYTNLKDSIITNVSRINKSTLILDYFIVENSIFQHAITSNGISCRSFPLSDQFIPAVRGFHKSIKLMDTEDAMITGNLLAMCLLEPFADEISKYKNLIIMPDEVLNEIPFEALKIRGNESRSKNYIVESKNISYRFSFLRRNYSNAITNDLYSTDFLGIAPYVKNDTSSNSLNGSANEVINITMLYKAKAQSASCLVGKEATYLNFSSGCLDAKILHISTHSFINKPQASLSFLELFPTGDNSNLLFPVFPSIPFHSDLLLLNSCETGVNLLNPNTGYVSFIRGLSNISVNNYLCTLWRIYDDPSYAFIMNFYANLLDGKDYRESLSKTKRDFIHSNIFSHPKFWAPFIIYENN
jgi:CHAT domain-containing protein/Tfp pilus assembly protein PilF